MYITDKYFVQKHKTKIKREHKNISMLLCSQREPVNNVFVGIIINLINFINSNVRPVIKYMQIY